MKLQHKFAALLLPAGLTAAGFIVFLTHKAVHSIIQKELDRTASILATSAALDAVPGFQAHSEALLLPLLQSLQKHEGAVYAAALDTEGKVVAHTIITEKGTVERDATTKAALSSDAPVTHTLIYRGEPVMEAAVPVWSPQRTTEKEDFMFSGVARRGPRTRLGVLKVAISMKQARETEGWILRDVILIVVLIGIVVCGLVLLQVRDILRPINSLMAGIGRVGRGEYDVIVPILSKDELGDLANSFNGMSEKLARTTVSKEYVEGILENMLDILIVTDSEGRIQTANPAALEALSYSAAELTGRPLASLFRDDAAIMSHLLSGPVHDLEVNLKMRTGNVLPALFSASALNARNGRLIGYVGVAKDMTERKRAESELLKAKSAVEAANKELEAFSYSVAHDLRAPLRAIDGFSQILLANYSSKIDEAGQDYLLRVRRGSKHMGQLIEDLLSLSRVTRSALRHEQVDLSEIAREISSRLSATKPVRDVAFVIADDLAAEGDPNLLRAAIENLLGNAWKYTGRHAKAKIEFGKTLQEGKPVYFVRDDGAGFDVAFAGKLFKPFSRLHTMSEFEGTGIGLATVQRIVERHGGRIWGEGRVEQGATFYFTLGEKS